MTAWTPGRVAIFKTRFFDFLGHVKFHSKELGGNTVLGDHVYYGQRLFLETVFKALENDIHDVKCLKSRQLGMSTITRALSLFWLGVHDGLQGALVFDTDPHREGARREIEAMISGLPKSLKFPGVRVSNRYSCILENGSQIQYMAAGTKASRSGGTLGRSSGFNLVHASEICSWENPEGITSFQQTLSESYPDRLYIWESTARGFNSWHDIWNEAKADNLNQATCFLGWWSKDIQRIERTSPQWSRYGESPITAQEAEKIALVKKLYDFDITAEQLAWFRRKTDPTSSTDADKQDDQFLQAEQAWDEESAFVLTGSSFFPHDRLLEARAKTSSNKYDAYKYYPGMDFTSCVVEAARSWRDTQLKVWEPPVDDACYVIASDPAFGADETNDRSAIQVLRCYADCIEQVAEFACASTPTNHFAWIIWSLCGWYGGGKSGTAGNPVINILEINGPGDAVWNEFRSVPQIVKTGYLRKAAAEKGLRDIFNNVRNYVYTRSDSMTAGSSFCWKTTGPLKVAIMERLRGYVIDGTVIIRSQDVLEEMRSVTRNGDVIKAEGRKKDDRVLAFAMGCRAWEERLRKSLIAGNRTRSADIAKRRMSIQDQFAVFTQNQLSAFFKSKSRARMLVEQEAKRQRWHRR